MKTFYDYGINVSKSSGHERVLCPHCSDSRKKSTQKCLAVNIDEGVWFCHHCGWSGCLKKEHSAYKIPVYSPAPLAPKAKEFFRKRKISEHVLKQNNIGMEKGDISFPYLKNGQVVNVKSRKLEKGFYQSAGAEQCLYRFDAISSLDGPLVITEGEMDALAVQSADWECVTSVPGGAINPGSKSFDRAFAFMESADKIIARFDKIYLALDDDGPGIAMTAELVRRIGPEKCWIVEYPEGCKDCNDILMKYGEDILLACLNDPQPCPVHGLYPVEKFRAQVMDRIFGTRQPNPKTGWVDLDKYYSPQLGLFSIITGIPSAGKSTFMDNLVLRLHKLNNWKFAIFSPENWPIDRHISLILEKILKRKACELCKADVTKGINSLNDFLYFIFLKNERLTLDCILAKARAAVFRYGIKGLVIDPWNEIEHQYQNMTEAQYLAQALSKVRDFASLNQVHVWVVAHPRILHEDRNGKLSPPTMYQISGGAHWRNKADFGLCLHRLTDGSGITSVHIQKVRFSDYGKQGTVDMFVKPPGIFYETASKEMKQ